MRSTLVAMALSCVVGSVFASTIDSQSVRFDGSQVQEVLNLRTEKTRTEYREERVARTCYRTVVAGHRTVCRRPPPPQPQQCWREPIYRTVPYTCYETRRVPYEVFENYVDANITINYSQLPEGLVASENITATLNGDLLTLRSNGSKKLIVELNSLTQNRRMEGNTLMLDAVATLNFHDALKVQEALKLTDARIQKSILTYNLGAIADLNLQHNLKIVNNPRLGGSTTLFDGILDAGNLSREERGATTAMSVKFEDLLGRTLSSGRYNITVSAEFKVGRAVLNAHEIGSLSVEKTIVYSIR